VLQYNAVQCYNNTGTQANTQRSGCLCGTGKQHCEEEQCELGTGGSFEQALTSDFLAQQA